jgi:hypothetical protein
LPKIAYFYGIIDYYGECTVPVAKEERVFPQIASCLATWYLDAVVRELPADVDDQGERVQPITSNVEVM